MLKKLALSLAAAALGFGVICLPPQHVKAEAAPVSQFVDQQLPRDPNNIYGQFDNGLSYIIRKNDNPPGKACLYLHVRTGALNETDKQNGLAHFLEHMAFNGSTHYKPLQLIPLLSHLGMTFGADTNAHTNLWETVFKLTMPDTKPETINTALTILSDYASGLNLAPIQIESERRVILEESRARKSVGQRMNRELTKELYPGTRLEKHDIIGDEEQIKTFPQSEFQDYWNTWYRPENMTLIVVGDIDPPAIIAAAKEKLGDFKARADARPPQIAGVKPFDAPKALILSDPEQVTGEVDMINLQPARPLITTTAQYRRQVLEGVCEWIVNRRFSDLVNKGNAPFRDAEIGGEDFLHEGQIFSAGAEGQPKDWSRMLDAVIAEVNRALDHGFTQHEMDMAKSELLSSSQWAVKTESSRDSTQIVNGLAGAIGVKSPMLSSQQKLDLKTQILDGITLDELHKIFVEDYQTKNYAYVLELPAPKDGEKLPSSEDVLAAASAAWAVKTQATQEVANNASLLPADPTPGKVISQETDKDLGLTTATFANGVVMHHKFSDYKKDQVLISITLPGGVLEETAANKGVSAVASLIFERPATSRFTSSQIRDLMTGKNVKVGGGIGPDTMSMNVAGSPADLPLGMQLANALLTDGVLEQPALDEWKKAELESLQAKKSRVEPQLSDAMSETIYGGDIRMAPMTDEIVNRQERSPAQDWFHRIASHAAIEVAVVGDIDLQSATDLVAKYVGSLPTRTQDFTALNDLRKIDHKAGPYDRTVHMTAITPKALVLAGFLGCDELDPDRRPLSMAARILSDRMIQRIRIKEQLVYSIQCQSNPGRAIPGTGTIFAAAPTDPKNADKLGATIQEMLKTFAADGPSEDELTTAKKQVANAMAVQMKEPSFWLVQIGEMKYRGRTIEDLKLLPGIFQTFTTEQVRDVMRKYVKDDRGVCIEIIPQVKPDPSALPEAVPVPADK